MSNGSHESLSDVLRQMAHKATEEPKDPPKSPPPEATVVNSTGAPARDVQDIEEVEDPEGLGHTQVSVEEETLIMAELDEETEEQTRNVSGDSWTGLAPPTPRAGRRKSSRKQAHHQMKAFAVPILATVGVLMLIPAIWATLLLGGTQVFASQRDDAEKMAKLMLVCWPIGLILLGSAVFYFLQMRKTPD